MDEIYDLGISGIMNNHWENILRRSIIHMSPLFSSKKIDSSPLISGLFFRPPDKYAFQAG
jgi:hypothetical protein